MRVENACKSEWCVKWVSGSDQVCMKWEMGRERIWMGFFKPTFSGRRVFWYCGHCLRVLLRYSCSIVIKQNRYGEITNERVPCALPFTFGLSYDLTQILQRDDDERASEQGTR